MPNLAAMSLVMAVRLSPAASRAVRAACSARSVSPSANQVSPPTSAIAAMKRQLSFARPQPVSWFARPDNV